RPCASFGPPLRWLPLFFLALPTVRGLTGGYGSVARCAGSRRLYVPLPRFEDSPGATLCHPLRGLTSFVCASAPGSRTHRGLRFCRPLRGLGGPLRTQNSELPQAAGRNFSSS